MKALFSDKKAVTAGIAAAVILSVLRTLQLLNATEYPSNLYAAGSDMLNMAYNILLVLSAVAICVLAFFDSKHARVKKAEELSIKGCNAVGVIMILGGAAWILPAVNDFSAGAVDLFTVCSLACCAAYVIGGMSIMMKSKIVPAHCVSAIFIIANYLLTAVKFYLDNPIITGMPQKLMLMLFYILTTLFWINMGRFICGGEKKLTRTALIASGYFSGACSAAYLVSCFALAAIDGEKWLQLADAPDLELIMTAFVPAAVAAVVQFSAKRAEKECDSGKEADDNDDIKAFAASEYDDDAESKADNKLSSDDEADSE